MGFDFEADVNKWPVRGCECGEAIDAGREVGDGGQNSATDRYTDSSFEQRSSQPRHRLFGCLKFRGVAIVRDGRQLSNVESRIGGISGPRGHES